jgi:hypothetical protein
VTAQRSVAPAPVSRAAAPASSATAVATDGAFDRSVEVTARWQSALQAINTRKRLLGAFLEESTFMGRIGDTVVVAMDDLHRAVVDEKDNRAIVAEELRRVFGEPLQIRCEPPRAAGPVPQRPSAEDTHAMVMKTLEWFGGEAETPKPSTGERTSA